MMGENIYHAISRSAELKRFQKEEVTLSAISHMPRNVKLWLPDRRQCRSCGGGDGSFLHLILEIPKVALY